MSKIKPLYISDNQVVGFCICQDCLEINDRAYVTFGEGHRCPCCGSTEPEVEIDELIANTIVLLNKKGYPTKACCSGHVTGQQGYISFDCVIEHSNLPHFVSTDFFGKYPFAETNMQDGSIIRWKIVESYNPIERMKDLVNKNIAIYKWADGLKDLKRENENNYALVVDTGI